MLSLIPRPYLILAVAALWLATAGISFYRGYHTGATLTEARHAAEVAKAQAATMKAAVERYKRDHLGPDHIDAPHFELVA